MRETDVIILGAGISGCFAAMLLARKGYRVVMISRDSGTAYHLPESWIYHLPASIEANVEAKLLTSLRGQSDCTFCSSDHKHSVEILVKTSSEKIERGDLVWVDRNRMDRVLLDAALEYGTTFLPLTHIVSCDISDAQVVICGESQNQLYEFKAAYLIDATGKTSFLSHHLKLPTEEKKLDPRVTYFSHFELKSEAPKKPTIVHVKGGYLFCIPVADQRLSIGCVIAENLVDPTMLPDEIFASAVSSSSYIAHLIAESKRVFPIISAKNYQRICLEPSALRYRLVGDAAAFLDPFFCPGIDFAFFSAEQAVESIEQNDAQHYKSAIQNWLKDSKHSIYEKIEHSDWKELLRLFADPHLPLAVPLMLSQAFGQVAGKNLPFKDGIALARGAYEVAPC